MYNKEIKVNQDEIPIILAELTDAAFNFIQRESYEKALILLQKCEGVLEVVSLDSCSRDKYVQFITYNNMAMCFQKLGMLEECMIYLKGSIQQISDPNFFKQKSIPARMKRNKFECKLKLQLCAILSQTQNHTEALDNSRKSVRLAHHLFKDLEELCQLYIDKINFRENLQAAHEQSDLEDDERSQIIQMVLESSPAKEIPKNFLEQSISLVERSALKLYPVVREVRRKFAGAPPQEPKKENDLFQVRDEEEEEEDEKPDMRSVLGFLNQNEWIFNMNIGNIMQIQPLQMKEFLEQNRDEVELSRDNFLEKLAIVAVSYFCMSTEMRFLLQSRANYLKPEVKKEREQESEFWHAKALEIACSFLPSECPLMNHILLSYQKHHDPTMQPIKEDEEQTDELRVIRPIKGVEQGKYQPIIRQIEGVKLNNLEPIEQQTIKELVRQLDSQNFEEVLKIHGERISDKFKNQFLKASVSEKQVQTLKEIIEERGVNTSFRAEYAPQGVEQTISPPKSVQARAFDEKNAPTTTQRLANEIQKQTSDVSPQSKTIEGLEKQLLGNDYPDKLGELNSEEVERKAFQELQLGIQNEKQGDSVQLPFDLQDSILVDDRESNLGETDAKLYDLLIGKILDNPQIDKEVLIKRLITKFEMESNVPNQIVCKSRSSKTLYYLTNLSATRKHSRTLRRSKDAKRAEKAMLMSRQKFNRTKFERLAQKLEDDHSLCTTDSNLAQFKQVLAQNKKMSQHRVSGDDDSFSIQQLSKINEQIFDGTEDRSDVEIVEGFEEGFESEESLPQEPTTSEKQLAKKSKSKKKAKYSTQRDRHSKERKMTANFDEPVIQGHTVALKEKAQTRAPSAGKHRQSKQKVQQNVSYLDGDSLFQDIDKTNSEQFTHFEDDVSKILPHSVEGLISKIDPNAKYSHGSSMMGAGEDDESDVNQTEIEKQRRKKHQQSMAESSIQDDEKERGNSSSAKKSRATRPSSGYTVGTRQSSSNLRKRKRNLANQTQTAVAEKVDLRYKKKHMASHQDSKNYRSDSSSNKHPHGLSVSNIENVNLKNAKDQVLSGSVNQSTLKKGLSKKRPSTSFAQQHSSQIGKVRKNIPGVASQHNLSHLPHKNTSYQSIPIKSVKKPQPCCNCVCNCKNTKKVEEKKPKTLITAKPKVEKKTSSVPRATIVRGRVKPRKSQAPYNINSSQSKSKSRKSKNSSSPSGGRKSSESAHKMLGSRRSNPSMQNEFVSHESQPMNITTGHDQLRKKGRSKKVQSMHQSSLCDLQKKVLENQKILLSMQQEQRLNSDSKNRKQNKKDSLGNILNDFHSQERMPARHTQSVQCNPQVSGTALKRTDQVLGSSNQARRKSGQNTLQAKTSASQNVQGLATILKAFLHNSSQMPAGHQTQNYPAANGNTLSQSKQSLKKAKFATNHSSEHAHPERGVAHKNRKSGSKTNSTSQQRRSNKNSKSRSRSPGQPQKAKIPRKKEFTKVGSHGQFMNGTTLNSLNNLVETDVNGQPIYSTVDLLRGSLGKDYHNHSANENFHLNANHEKLQKMVSQQQRHSLQKVQRFVQKPAKKQNQQTQQQVLTAAKQFLHAHQQLLKAGAISDPNLLNQHFSAFEERQLFNQQHQLRHNQEQSNLLMDQDQENNFFGSDKEQVFVGDRILNENSEQMDLDMESDFEKEIEQNPEFNRVSNPKLVFQQIQRHNQSMHHQMSQGIAPPPNAAATNQNHQHSVSMFDSDIGGSRGGFSGRTKVHPHQRSQNAIYSQSANYAFQQSQNPHQIRSSTSQVLRPKRTKKQSSAGGQRQKSMLIR